MAVARARFDDRHLRRLHAVADEPRAAARDEHVHRPMQPHELVGRRAVGGGNEADAPLRHAGSLGGVGEHAGHGLVRAGRHAPAAQHRRIAGLQADARRVGRHVGARLVHHGHHAERHAHALEPDAALERARVLHPAERVGQHGQLLERGRHVLDAPLVEHKAVHQALLRARRARGRHVLRVRRDDLRRMRAQGRRHGRQRRVTLLGARLRQRPARGPRRLGDAPHLLAHGFVRHSRSSLLEHDQLVAVDERLVGQA